MHNICQSCGMAMEEAQSRGSNADGSKNLTYCRYCFQNGQFEADETMEEMIESCIPFRVGTSYPDAEAARADMLKYFPSLKRWKK